jgi:hypothetical protein
MSLQVHENYLYFFACYICAFLKIYSNDLHQSISATVAKQIPCQNIEASKHAVAPKTKTLSYKTTVLVWPCVADLLLNPFTKSSAGFSFGRVIFFPAWVMSALNAGASAL